MSTFPLILLQQPLVHVIGQVDISCPETCYKCLMVNTCTVEPWKLKHRQQQYLFSDALDLSIALLPVVLQVNLLGTCNTLTITPMTSFVILFGRKTWTYLRELFKMFYSAGDLQTNGGGMLFLFVIILYMCKYEQVTLINNSLSTLFFR